VVAVVVADRSALLRAACVSTVANRQGRQCLAALYVSHL
jgi:hypothetical protein